MSRAKQRVTLVTRSSRGLGSAIARRLARDGLAVAVNGLRDDAQVLQVVHAIRADAGVADAFPADITDGRQVAEAVAAVTDRLGPVEVLVLNATGPQPEAPLPDVAWADHLAQLDFFVKSPVSTAVAPSRDRVGAGPRDWAPAPPVRRPALPVGRGRPPGVAGGLSPSR